MSFVTFVPLALAVGICLVPAWLMQRPERARAQDDLVASEYTRPELARNASIAYALRMAAFGPLFAWGASGEFWPAAIASVFFGLGTYAIYVLRRPLLEFIDGALSTDRSITVHEFIARQHGNDARVRVLAASLTLFALLGLIVGEALVLAAILEPMLKGGALIAQVLVLGALLSIVLTAMRSGHSGIMHSAQLHLGMLYLGLFGSTILLLYLHLSTVTPMPPRGTLAVVVVAVCGAIVLVYRRSRYVDTDPIRGGVASDGSERVPSAGARAVSRFEKILNVWLSVLLVLVIVVAFLEVQATGVATIVRDSVAALRAGTRVPGVGLLALCLLPLVYPLVDVTNWLRLAATRKDLSPSGEPGGRSAALRGFFRIYAAETSLLWLFTCAFGALAVLATGTQDGADSLQEFIARLISADNRVTIVVLSLLLIAAFAMMLSTIGALFSASLCTLCYDMLAPLEPGIAAAGQSRAANAAMARRRRLAAGGLGLALAAAFGVAESFLHVSFASGAFLAVLFALCCAQVSFAPLILGPIVGRACGGIGTVSSGWALVILGSGAASGIAAVTAHLLTGVEAWLWSASPLCLGSGAVLFAIARSASPRQA